MAILDETRFVERLTFFDGERLFAEDLQGLEAFNREMRWLHNRSLHQPGIGNGYAVYGKKGDREVTVGPGYAIDALGREIVETGTEVLPIPPVSGGSDGKAAVYELTVSYPDDSDLEEAETREGVCLPGGAVRLREAPVFCWVQSTASTSVRQLLQDGMRIVLARVEILNCRLYKDVSTAQRLSARPARAPYIACGVVSNPDWKLDDNWGDDAGKVQCLTALPRKLITQIDTTSGQFVTAPSYTARLTGPRIRTLAGNRPFLLDGLINIVDASPTGFTLEITPLVQALVQEGQIEVDQDTFKNWGIVWMGVEG